LKNTADSEDPTIFTILAASGALVISILNVYRATLNLDILGSAISTSSLRHGLTMSSPLAQSYQLDNV